MRRALAVLGLCILAFGAHAQSSREKTATHVVKPGDTLNGLAQSYLGDSSRWPEIHKVNPQLKNPNVLQPGETIRIPLDIRAGSAVVTDLARRVEKKPVPQPWEKAQRGDKLREKDGIRTFSESSAKLTFEDGADLILSEDSLVFLQAIERRRSGRGRDVIEIVDGQADLRTRTAKRDTSDIEVVIGSTTIRPKSSDGKLEARGRVTETKTAQVMSYTGDTAVEAAGAVVKVDQGMGTFVEEGKKPAPPEKLLPAPAIVAPVAGARPELLHLEWEPVDEAVAYTVEICSDPDCTALEVRVTGIEQLAHTVESELVVGPRFWRVTAQSSSGLDGYPSATVQFTKTAAVRGRIVDDRDGDGTIDDGGPVRGTVRLFSDDGSGEPDGRDRMVGESVADESGHWTLGDIDQPGSYWVVVDSRSLRLPATGDEIWMEQTYGPKGSRCAVVEGGTRAEAGPCHGGRRALISDGDGIVAAEHLAAVTISASGPSGIVFGFSPSAVVHDRDDPGSMQGSLRQFVLNANAVGGGRSMRFVPGVPAGVESGDSRWWRIRARAPLPPISGDGTVIDGAAWTPEGKRIDSNGGWLGSEIAVGTDQVSLERAHRPELEVDGRELSPGLVRFEADGGLRNIALTGGFSTVEVAAGEVEIVDVVIGLRADGSSSATPGEIGLHVTGGTARISRSIVGDQRRYGLFAAPGSGSIVASNVEVVGAGVENESGDAVALHSSGSRLENLYIHGCGASAGRLDRRSGVEIWGPRELDAVKGNVVEGSTISDCARGVLIGSRAEENRVRDMVFSSMDEMNVRFYVAAYDAMPRANLVMHSVFGDAVAPITAEIETGMPRPECDSAGPLVVAPPPLLEGLEWKDGTLRLRGRTCVGYSVEPYLYRDGAWHPMPLLDTSPRGEFELTVDGVGPLQKVGAIAISPEHGTSLMATRDPME